MGGTSLSLQGIDQQKLEKLVEEISKYDVFDTLARISALNLLPENQNKGLILDALIAAVLTKPAGYYASTIRMSAGKFRSICHALESLDAWAMIDPIENPFVENILFYGNYIVFSGIDQTPGYNLQNLIGALFLSKNNFDKSFLMKSMAIIRTVLEISTRAALRLGYTIETLENTVFSELRVPDSETMSILTDSTVIYGETLRQNLGSEFEELWCLMLSNFEDSRSMEEVLNLSNQTFYSKPFLYKEETDKLIVLNMSLLPAFAFFFILQLADKIGCKDSLVSSFNDRVFNDCRKSLKTLGHEKINESSLGLVLENTSYYKEMLFNVFNNQVMLLCFLCDDGDNYNALSMHDMHPKDRHQSMVQKRLSYFCDKLSGQGIGIRDIFVMVIISGFGRGILLATNSEAKNRIFLNPFELRCISVNERTRPGFIPKFIRAKSQLRTFESLFSDIVAVNLYVSNGYSFYLSDESNRKKDIIFFGPGDSVEYLVSALQKENRKLVTSYMEGYYTEVVLEDKKRKIYVEDHAAVPRVALLVSSPVVDIWVYSPEIREVSALSIYQSLVDAISYWLAECRSIIQAMALEAESIAIRVLLTGNPNDYYINVTQEGAVSDYVRLSVSENCIDVMWTPEAYRLLQAHDNTQEKEMIRQILACCSTLSRNSLDIGPLLEGVFQDPLKKKFIALDISRYPYLKPPMNTRFRMVSSEEENQLLDEICASLLASGKWNYGVVPNEDRGAVSHYVVGFLYSMLQDEIAEISPVGLVEQVCFDLEIIMYNLMLMQKQYAFDLSCYPERGNELFSNYNELNKASRALKFLAEYIAARPPLGHAVLGEWQFDRLMAICCLIIDWAYKNDLFHYSMINTPIELLKSGRIGLKQTEFNRLQEINAEFMTEQLQYNSSASLRKPFKTSIDDQLDELDAAFLNEYGFTYCSFCECVLGIITYGDEIEGEVKVARLDELSHWLRNNCDGIDGAIVDRIIEWISLKQREDFLLPDEPFRKEDVYPWRLNRELSFTRRPIILRDCNVIWGNRQLYHMLCFVTQLVAEGKLRCTGKRLKSLLGKISNRRGNSFCQGIHKMITEIGDFDAYLNVKSINGKKLVDDDNKDLGDIDVLIVSRSTRQIILAEVKDFSYSRDPYELHLEYKTLFEDTEKKKSFWTKHKRREEWIMDHIEDVAEEYGLERANWSVCSVFIVDSPTASNAFYKVGANIIAKSSVSATLKSPEADVIACPRIAIYNGLILGKEKDVSHAQSPKIRRRRPHQKHDHRIRLCAG